ncbi:MAG TPA: tetratricopeptide repeat protein [Thermoanaerobaculia bacterium]|nr:tetratricopeptide repeat protein [Thermoanaerobaculia bacterium]
MDVERWSRIDALFDEALTLPPEERAAFLDRACGDDRELREAVERLIVADESANTFLERPPLIVLEGGEEAAEGSRFGPYRIERLLSRGGMGTVYLATRDDGQFERRVALKLLHPGTDDPEDLQRFRAERQILARLEHPAIARLYDGGETEQGVPFLVLEYVEGLPLDDYCDHNRLEIDDRLRLFRRLLDAVSYAHQNLLVHRDLKPANILVTAEGEPKLLDFGIAKQLAREREGEPGLTRFRMMTPGYASPEQVRGEAITTASDVYALGVVLYELLCGRSPYRLKHGLPHELEMAILEQEPERPSQALDREDGPPAERIAAARCMKPRELRRQLRGDLDTIVLTALRKEPQRRYQSVIELAADIDRYLQEMPVSARPDKPLYRAGKFVRRHRLSVALTGLALILIAGLFISLVQQRRRVERERDTSRAALAFLVDVFEHADPYQKGAENVSARELLETGARRARLELASDPEVQAGLLDAIGQASVGLGQLDDAAPLLERSLAARRRLPPSLELAESLEHAGWLHFLRSDYDKAEPLLREAVALRRRLPSGPTELAAALVHLGTLLTERHQSTDEARSREIEGILLEALGLYQRASDDLGVASTRFQLAKVKKDRGDLPGAERLYRQVLSAQRRLYGEDHPEVAQCRRALALTLIVQAKPGEAKALLRQALASQRRVLPKDHPDIAATLNDLALAYTRTADYASAEPLYREALASELANHGENHADTATVLFNLASAVQGQGRLKEAAELHERSLATRRALYGEKHIYVAQVEAMLARIRSEQGRHGEALDLARRSLATGRELLEPGHNELIGPLRAMGTALLNAGRPAEAEPYLRESLDILRKTRAPGYFQTARIEVLLGDCLARLGRREEARSMLAQGLATLEAQFPPDHPWVKDARAKLDLVKIASR